MSRIQISEERGVRYLSFGSRLIQGAMRLARPFALELEYTREMMFPLLVRDDRWWPRRALMIGLGAGSVAKFLYRHRPRSTITVVESREDVAHIAGQFFKLPDDPPRLVIEIGDGLQYLSSPGPAFDLILVDGYDARGRVGALDSEAFYRRCRARMRSDAMLATNLLSRHRQVDASLDRMRAAFDGRAMALPATSFGNVIALAATGAPVDCSPAQLRTREKALRDETGLGLASTLTRLAKAAGPSVW
ncbi:MAG TPA: spermidine synthase [Casimicrobiaceae bacterium]|nr:spermidine synthase [Casimicrobiaceae bacterium]